MPWWEPLKRDSENFIGIDSVLRRMAGGPTGNWIVVAADYRDFAVILKEMNSQARNHFGQEP